MRGMAARQRAANAINAAMIGLCLCRKAKTRVARNAALSILPSVRPKAVNRSVVRPTRPSVRGGAYRAFRGHEKTLAPALEP